jgi:His-Xaa-Ser system radical SAM maturase HxsC
MLKLSGRGAVSGLGEPLVVKVFREKDELALWSPAGYIARGNEAPPAQAKVLFYSDPSPGLSVDLSQHVVVTAFDASHLADGDVVSVYPDGVVRTLYRRESESNTLFATERCNSFCLMCSQPPRKVQDDWRVEEMLSTIDLADSGTTELGVSGGEPTLLGDGFLRVVQRAKDRLPSTGVHVLTNGRLFRYQKLADKLGEICHPDLMLGVPVYSDLATEHDYVVQSEGAFEDTYLGLHNLARAGVAVEIRVVVHKATAERLKPLAEFIYRNFPFAAHVTFMGLEKTGFAIANWKDLWVDPVTYMVDLCGAVTHLDERGVNVSLFNHQRCVVPSSHRRFCRRSISDWKVEYVDVCSGCDERENCCGFFCFNIPDGISAGIAPITQSAER